MSKDCGTPEAGSIDATSSNISLYSSPLVGLKYHLSWARAGKFEMPSN